MKIINNSFRIGLILILSLLYLVETYAQDEKFQITLQSGPFIPQSWTIKGYNQIYFENNSPVSAIVSGFGEGFDLNLSTVYYFSGWGLNLNSGIRLLKNDLAMNFAPDGERHEFENHLTIIPVTLSLVDRIQISDSKITPYLGMGTGILFTQWE